MTFQPKFKNLEKLADQEPELKDIKAKWETRVHELFGEVTDEKDQKAMEELILEAMEASPETQHVYIETLKRRQQERNSQEKSGNLVIDSEGKLINRDQVISGENQ